jgi:transposase
MKNRYQKRSHLSEAKFRTIIRLFAADLEASQIAVIAGVSRQTANALLRRIRARIAGLAERESCFREGEIEIDESYFGARRVRGKRGRGAAGKTIVFGMKKRGDRVYTQVVKNCSAATLVPIIKGLVPGDATVCSDEWKAYDGLVNAGYKRHYRVRHSGNVFANGRVHVNGIENFWGIAKTRLARFRGIHKSTFHLHLKETEWRFNHRHENLYLVLLKEFRVTPL